ncbi:MAG: hypothetical protein ACKO3S_03365 [bacterium]
MRHAFALVLMLTVLLAGVAHAAPARTLSVKDSPGYVPLQDPDSLAERLGRRPNAKAVSMPFQGGARSLDDLGRAVCRALHRGSVDSVMALAVTPEEFRVILWPEFPQSRPATGLRWEDGWSTLAGRLNGGSVAATRDLGGEWYEFQRIERTAPSMRYRNFAMHNGIVIVAKDGQGTVHRFTFVRAVVERKGRFKLYSLKD